VKDGLDDSEGDGQETLEVEVVSHEDGFRVTDKAERTNRGGSCFRRSETSKQQCVTASRRREFSTFSIEENIRWSRTGSSTTTVPNRFPKEETSRD